MKLRTDTIGHFDNPTEINIREAIVYSGEGGHEGDLVKLTENDEYYISIWVGKRSIGHTLTLKSGVWKLDSADKLSSEMVINLFVSYLHGDFTELIKLKWKRPIDKAFIENIMKLQN